jgi:hypothetical protein
MNVMKVIGNEGSRGKRKMVLSNEGWWGVMEGGEYEWGIGKRGEREGDDWLRVGKE